MTVLVRKIFKVTLFTLAGIAVVFLGILVLLKPSGHLFSLPTVTEISGGHAGDPINIAFLGDRNSITKVFLAARWLVPDPITATTTTRIIEASIANSPYPAASVSNLYLFGRAQDLAFEMPTDTVRDRHHVRLWQTTDSLSGETLWIGTASYDSGIELSGVTALPTHHISPNIDAERNFVVKSLESVGIVSNVSAERNSYPKLLGFNGGGDWYFDDGVVDILFLK